MTEDSRITSMDESIKKLEEEFKWFQKDQQKKWDANAQTQAKRQQVIQDQFQAILEAINRNNTNQQHNPKSNPETNTTTTLASSSAPNPHNGILPTPTPTTTQPNTIDYSPNKTVDEVHNQQEKELDLMEAQVFEDGNLKQGCSDPNDKITTGILFSFKPHLQETIVGTYTNFTNTQHGNSRIEWICADEIAVNLENNQSFDVLDLREGLNQFKVELIGFLRLLKYGEDWFSSAGELVLETKHSDMFFRTEVEVEFSEWKGGTTLQIKKLVVDMSLLLYGAVEIAVGILSNRLDLVLNVWYMLFYDPALAIGFFVWWEFNNGRNKIKQGDLVILIVLSIPSRFGIPMATTLTWKYILAYVIGNSQGLIAMISVAARIVYSILQSHMLTVRTRLWSIQSQWTCLLVWVASIWTKHKDLSAYILMGVATSRLGWWMFDMFVIQLMQELLLAMSCACKGNLEPLLVCNSESRILSTTFFSEGISEAMQICCELVHIGVNMQAIIKDDGLGIDYFQYVVVFDCKNVKHHPLVSHHSVLIFEAVFTSVSPAINTYGLQYVLDVFLENSSTDYRNLTSTAVRGGSTSYLLGMCPTVGAQAKSGNTPENVMGLFVDWMIGFLFAVSFIGLFFIDTLRKLIILKYKMTYPNGTTRVCFINSFHFLKGAKFAKKHTLLCSQNALVEVSFGHLFSGSLLEEAVSISWEIMRAAIAYEKSDGNSADLSSLYGNRGYRIFIVLSTNFVSLNSVALLCGDSELRFGVERVTRSLGDTKGMC